MAFIRKRNRFSEDMQNKLQKMYATHTSFKSQKASGTATAVLIAKSPSMDWQTSITRRAITCLECGESFTQLSVHHLRVHGLDGCSYRAKYGISQTWPLASYNTAARLRRVIYKARPWEKSSRCRKGQARHGTASPEPEVEAVHEEAEELHAEAPAQPKEQRKTTLQKQTARKKSLFTTT